MTTNTASPITLRFPIEASQFQPERVTLHRDFPDGSDLDITVMGPTKRQPNGCVNWPGWGEQSPEVTAAVAEMLAEGARIAPNLRPQVAK
jgi:hypothetical protein